jgi:alpha-galactosidase
MRDLPESLKDHQRALLNRRDFLRNGIVIASGCAFVPEILHATADDGLQNWTIANSSITRTIEWLPGSGLFTRRFSCIATHADLIVAEEKHAAPEFSFNCNGRTSTGTNASFTLLDAVPASLPKGNSLTIRLRHNQLPLEVSVVYRVYNGHSAIRKHLFFTNTGSSPLKISHLNIESLSVSLGAASELTLLTQYGTVPRETFYTGRSEDAGLLLANSLTGNGLAILSEVPGYMKRTEVEGFYDPHHARIGVLYDTDLMPFERTIAPGEQFTTAAASLIAFRNGDGFNDPHWLLPSYTAQVLERRVDAQGPPWIFNTWEPFHRTVNHDLVLELVEGAAAMGMDIFTIDDGWQKEYGENAVDLAAFPGGLQPILDAVESKGMRLGLWIPLAAIGTSTADYQQHPEWRALDQQGQPKITGTAAGAKGVICMATPYRDLAAARIVDAIERFHLAYVKLDLTTIFNAYGEAPGCWASGHMHSTWAESLNRIYEGIAYVTAKIYERHPDVLLDLTFELWGQKHIIDAGLLAAGDLDWMSNVADGDPDSSGPLQARQLLYQRGASMPVESMLIGNLHAELPTIQESFATAIGSAPVLLGDLRKLSAADRAWYHDKIAWFKKLRRSTKISESFFPLGSWQQTQAAAWDGFARFDRNGNGIVVLFRNKSDALHAQVALPLLPAGQYGLRSMITGKQQGPFTNADWAAGIRIIFPEHEPVEILEVTTSSR